MVQPNDNLQNFLSALCKVLLKYGLHSSFISYDCEVEDSYAKCIYGGAAP